MTDVISFMLCRQPAAEPWIWISFFKKHEKCAEYFSFTFCLQITLYGNPTKETIGKADSYEFCKKTKRILQKRPRLCNHDIKT